MKKYIPLVLMVFFFNIHCDNLLLEATFINEIKTIDDLTRFSEITYRIKLSDINKKIIFKVMNDIDASGTILESGFGMDINSHITIDGRGHRIRNLGSKFISGNHGTVKNLILENIEGSFAGSNYGTITNCHLISSVSKNNNGGFVSTNSGIIANSSTVITMTGTNSSGFCRSNSGTIKNCFATGTITTAPGHGFVNTGTGTIENCYSAVTLASGTQYGFKHTAYTGTITGSFFDLGLAPAAESGSGTGLSTTDMQNAANYTAEGWDFTTTWDIDSGSYPYLR